MMRWTAGWLVALSLGILFADAARAQGPLFEEAVLEEPAQPEPYGEELAPAPAAVDGSPDLGTGDGEIVYFEPGVPQSRSCRRWLRRHGSCDCGGPVGLNGPILSELYIQTGVSNPVAGGFLNNTIECGWIIQGGGRSLFFNTELNRAWVVDFGVANITNNGNRPNLVLNLQGAQATVRNFNRTYVSLGLGREWYLRGNADSAGRAWRAGCDFGGRYGTARLDLNTNLTPLGFARTNDIFGALYLAAHTDLEFPWRCCHFILGTRLEWDHQWIDEIGPSESDNLENFNVLLNFGVRF